METKAIARLLLVLCIAGSTRNCSGSRVIPRLRIRQTPEPAQLNHQATPQAQDPRGSSLIYYPAQGSNPLLSQLQYRLQGNPQPLQQQSYQQLQQPQLYQQQQPQLYQQQQQPQSYQQHQQPQVYQLQQQPQSYQLQQQQPQSYQQQPEQQRPAVRYVLRPVQRAPQAATQDEGSQAPFSLASAVSTTKFTNPYATYSFG